MKRKIRILVGNRDSAISGVILETIEWHGKGQYELEATSTERAEQVLEYARSQEFDLCILILNNLSYSPKYHLPDGSSEAQWADDFTDFASNFVAQLKQTFTPPIIAMAGWPRVLWGEKATRAGANYFFLLPYSVAEFTEAVKTCLSAEKTK